MSTKPEEVQKLDQCIADAIKQCAKAIGTAVVAGRSTCVHCVHFVQVGEICALANQRPPARVIAFGCRQFTHDEIPF